MLQSLDPLSLHSGGALPPAGPSGSVRATAAPTVTTPPPATAPIYRRLEPERIVATTRNLAQRVEERFPGSSLAAMAAELASIADECQGRLIAIRRANWPLRLLGLAGVLLVVAGVVAAASLVDWRMEDAGLADLVQAVEAAVNDAVFLVIGLFFLLNLESRLKRRKVLDALHELRSMTHIADMHQLTKDPEQVLVSTIAASSTVRTMTRFELTRYLDYCAELLSLIAKVAALHAQDLRDPVVLSAVTEIESLTVGLSNKIWQKIVILDEIRLRAGEVRPAAEA